MQKPFLIAGLAGLVLVATADAQQRRDPQQPRPVPRPVIDSPRPATDQAVTNEQGTPTAMVDPNLLATACTGTSIVTRRISRTCPDGSRATEEMRCTVRGVGGLFPNCIYDEECEVTFAEECPPAETETPDGD